MKRLPWIVLAVFSLVLVLLAVFNDDTEEVTGTVTEVSYWGTVGAGNVTGIILEEDTGTSHYLSVKGISEWFTVGQRIRVVFNTGGVDDSSMNSMEEFEEDGVIKTKKTYWWTIIERELVPEN